ncbi:hypothetical protein ACH5RR_008748 [Cinchona calisaya]|uniref:Uncharacterized protein n=1 Tax=Cinchona calisaya TaxID=153742 RepID=A0ABD3AC77_9GENT
MVNESTLYISLFSRHVELICPLVKWSPSFEEFKWQRIEAIRSRASEEQLDTANNGGKRPRVEISPVMSISRKCDNAVMASVFWRRRDMKDAMAIHLSFLVQRILAAGFVDMFWEPVAQALYPVKFNDSETTTNGSTLLFSYVVKFEFFLNPRLF